MANEVSPQITSRPNESIRNGVYEVKAPLLISAIMQILSSLWQIGGLDIFFFPRETAKAHRTSGIRKPRRTYVSTTLRRIMAICNADLPWLRRTDAGRPTRIIAKSRDAQTCTCATLGALYARAAFIEHYLFPLSPLPILLFLENIAEM